MSLNQTRLHVNKMIKKQNGASLLLGVFIIVVISLLSTIIAKVISTSAETVSFEVYGARAYATAVSGNEWALQQLYPIQGSGTCSGITKANAPDFNRTEVNPSCFIEDISCTQFRHDNVDYYTIKTTGMCQVGDVTTSRTLQIQSRSIN
jgi:MSHA biogenesis protein MshP